jgi:hypothetical protein
MRLRVKNTHPVNGGFSGARALQFFTERFKTVRFSQLSPQRTNFIGENIIVLGESVTDDETIKAAEGTTEHDRGRDSEKQDEFGGDGMRLTRL